MANGHVITKDEGDLLWYLNDFQIKVGKTPAVLSFYLHGKPDDIRSAETLLRDAAVGITSGPRTTPPKNFAPDGMEQQLNMVTVCHDEGRDDFYAIVLKDGGNRVKDDALIAALKSTGIQCNTLAEYVVRELKKMDGLDTNYRIIVHGRNADLTSDANGAKGLVAKLRPE